MSNIRHHPRIETLGEFAAGKLDEARSVVLATHAAQCRQCSEAISELELLGGFFLETVDPVPMAPGGLEQVLSQSALEAEKIQTADVATNVNPERQQPLRAFLKKRH